MKPNNYTLGLSILSSQGCNHPLRKTCFKKGSERRGLIMLLRGCEGSAHSPWVWECFFFVCLFVCFVLFCFVLCWKVYVCVGGVGGVCVCVCVFFLFLFLLFLFYLTKKNCHQLFPCIFFFFQG